MESLAPTGVVLALVRVINRDASQHTAQSILDPLVQIRMDAARHRGIKTWCMWIHLIHNCGRVTGLRLTNCHTWCDAHDPDVVHLSGRWSGLVGYGRKPRMSEHCVRLRYLIRDGRIVAIWTRKSNYEFVFGRWIRYSICYWIFLGWAFLYFEAVALRTAGFLPRPS